MNTFSLSELIDHPVLQIHRSYPLLLSFNMCLPTSFLKTYTIFGAMLVLLASLGLLGATIYGYIISDIIVDQSSSLQKGILIGLIIGESLLVVGAILGIVGSKQRNPCLLFIFTIVVIVFTVAFVGLGIAADYVPNSVFQKESCQTTDLEWLVAARRAYETSSIHCTELCPCDWTNRDQFTSSEITKIRQVHPVIDDSNGHHRLQECPAFIEWSKKTGNDYSYQLAETFRAVEYTLSCSGWCYGSDNSIHIFSNINDGKPTDYCYPKLKRYVDEYSHIVMWVSIGFGIFLGLVVLGNICLCCHPDRKHLRGFNRFVDSDDIGSYNNAPVQGGYRRYN